MSISIALFGGTVMLCLLVTNFLQLVAARIATAIGEAGCMPSSSSLVGDYFPAPADRTRAMAVYWLAIPLGSLLSFMVGGWLNELYGWRVTFFLLGLPALLVAILVKATMTEPRQPAIQTDVPKPLPPPMADVLRVLWSQRSTRHLGLALIVLFTLQLGLGPWMAAFMVRSHGLGTAELGLWFELIYGFGGIAGTWMGGYIAGRWFAADERGQMRALAVMIALQVPCYALFLLLPQKNQAFAALIPLAVISGFFFAPSFALLQRLVTDNMRATALAVVMLLANLIGMGLGPQLVGVLSDVLQPTLGNDSLRYAMLVLSSTAVWAAYHLWQVGGTVTIDLPAVARRNQTSTTQWQTSER
jgi:MFS family permease